MRRFLSSFVLILCLVLFSSLAAYSQCGAAMVTQPGNLTLCNGSAATAINFTSPVSGTTYKWTNDNTAIGLAASGNGNIVGFTTTNTSGTPITATITVTPYTTTPYAYIPNQNDDNVSVIDVNTRTVVSTIPVGDYPQGVAVSPDGTKVYVTNTHANTVSVISTATNTVVATIGGLSAPFGVAASPDGTKLYVANNGAASISVINTITYTAISSITVGSVPQGVAVSPDGTKVYVTNYGSSSNSVSVINTATNTVTTTITGFTSPYGIAINPDGSKVYVSRYASNTVWVINTATNTFSPIAVGSAIGWPVLSPDGTKLYVSNYSSNTISIINTATNTEVLPRIAVGNGPFGISASPDDSKLYVSNYLSNTVSVINTTDNSLEGTVGVGNGPVAIGKAIALVSCPGTAKTFTITVNPAPVATITYGSTPYCATGTAAPVQIGTTGGTYSSTVGLSISATTGIIDLGSSTPGTYIVNYTIAAGGGCAQVQATASITINALPTVTQPSNQIVCNSNTVPATPFSGSAGASFSWTNSNPAIGLSASGTGNLPSFTATNATSNPITSTVTVTPLASRGSFAYVANSLSDNISVISTATNTAVATVAVGDNPYGMAVSPDGSKVYVANYLSGNVSVISTATNTAIATIAVGNSPTGIAVSPDGSKVYVANYASNNVSVISTATHTVTATIAVGIGPLGISLLPDGSKVYVVNLGTDNVSVISTATQTVSATIGVGNGPRCISISPDGNRLYVVNFHTRDVSVIAAASNAVVATVAVGSNPFGIAVSPDGNTVYVSNGDADNVSVISAATATVTTTVAVGRGPRGISVSPDGSTVYVVNYFSDDVSVIATATNTVTATVAAGDGPISAGYFIASPSPCTGTPQRFTITVNPTPSATVTYTGSPYCAGTGTATPTLTGTTGGTYSATAGLSINAATGAIDIGASAAGTYTVTYTVAPAGGCLQYTTSASFTINPTPATPIVTPSSSTTFCAGGSVLLTSSATSGNRWYKDGMAITGAPAQTYTANTSGVYTVVVTAGSCSSAPSTAITVAVTALPVTPTVTAGGAVSFCAGGSVVLTASTATGNQWYKDGVAIPGAGNSTWLADQSGNYSVTNTQNGCLSPLAVPVVVRVTPFPPVPIITINGDELTTSAATGLQWYFNNAVIPGATRSTYTPQLSGAYTVQVTQNGCSSISAVHNFLATIHDPVSEDYKIYPNPVHKTLRITYTTTQTLEVKVFDILGRNVYEGKLAGSGGSISFESLEAGLYQLSITNVTTRKTIHTTIVKQ